VSAKVVRTTLPRRTPRRPSRRIRRSTVTEKQDGTDLSIKILRIEIVGLDRLNIREDSGFCAHAFAPATANQAAPTN
jgi:hypothetical protein